MNPRWCVLMTGLLAWLLADAVVGGQIRRRIDTATGWQVLTLTQARTVAQVCPEAGGNVFSITVAGTEYLRTPPSLQQLPGVSYGNPILYPTPNRVRNARFEFEGTVFQFPANNGENFIHGLVNRAAWSVQSQLVTNRFAEITLQYEFQSGTQQFEWFPRPHRLRMTIRVSDGEVRWTYEVDNRDGRHPVPFGFACHPYFIYQGRRAETFLTVPATHWMEAESLLPTGNLIPLEGHPLDARQPRSLAGYRADDVFWGVNPKRPTRIEFRDVKRTIELWTSDEFAHLVVYTPDQPFFCIENQTCATDAHNLNARGFRAAARLQVCEPGQQKGGWVAFRFMPR